MRTIIFFAITLAISMTACNEEQGENLSTEVDANGNDSSSCINTDRDMISEWEAYFESSDQGAWEDSASHSLAYWRTGYLYDENALEVPVYTPYAITTCSDTIYVTDSNTMQVVAMNSEGSVFWKTGGQGEGPGHFANMLTLAASGRYVAALNRSLGRIEFFNKDGSFSHNLQFSRPQDIIALNDTTFLVASSEQPGGAIHVLNAHSGIERSFGEVCSEYYDGILRSDLMRLCTDGVDRVAIFNRYEGLLSIYTIETGQPIYSGSREYPATSEPPRHITGSDGQTRTVNFPIGGNAFRGPEGMLNVVICNYMEDGSFISDPEYLDFAPVTCVDRYDWDGHYLDSYCLPDSCLNYVASLPDGRLVGRNFSEGMIVVFDRE